MRKSDLTFDQISIYYDGYRAHIDFYQHVLATKGIASKYTSLDSVNENEIIAVGDENQLKEIGAEYKYKILVSEKFARLVKIIKPKNYRDLVLKSKSVLLDSLCYSKCTPWKMELLSMNNSNETAVSAFSDFETNYDCDDFRQHIVTAKS